MTPHQVSSPISCCSYAAALCKKGTIWMGRCIQLLCADGKDIPHSRIDPMKEAQFYCMTLV